MTSPTGRALLIAVVTSLLVACGGSATSKATTVTADAGADSAPSDAAAGSAADAQSDANGAGGASDGTPSYTSACTPLSAQNGHAINTYHGRLDGLLSYVVPQGGPKSCNGDYSHVHLQVRAGGNVYDVAVDIGKFQGDVLTYEANMPLPDGAWSEGWHGNDKLDYVALGLKSSQFTPVSPSGLGQKLQSELAGVNHISVFGIGYSQHNGCHDIHYMGSGNDGAIVLQPLSAHPHVLFFHFSTQSF